MFVDGTHWMEKNAKKMPPKYLQMTKTKTETKTAHTTTIQTSNEFSRINHETE